MFGDGAGNFSFPTYIFPGVTPFSIAVGDFNGDGKQDLVVANRGSNNVSILLGDGAGHFSAATNFPVFAFKPQSVAVGDFNGDGKQDLAVANSLFNSNNVSILLGDGAGNFSGATNFAIGSGPVSVAVGDFNGDGKQDLAMATDSVQTTCRSCCGDASSIRIALFRERLTAPRVTSISIYRSLALGESNVAEAAARALISIRLWSPLILQLQ